MSLQDTRKHRVLRDAISTDMLGMFPELFDTQIMTVNDIALVFLDLPVFGIPLIQINGNNANIPYDHQLLTMIGAGWTEFKASLPTQLMEVQLPNRSPSVCNVSHYFDYYGIIFEPTVMICAGGSSGYENKTTQGEQSKLVDHLHLQDKHLQHSIRWMKYIHSSEQYMIDECLGLWKIRCRNHNSGHFGCTICRPHK